MKPSIGVVIHGPEVIDSGGARLVLDALSEHYDVIAMLGGTMGRTAVLDHFLEDRIDISKRMGPSETVNFLSWTDAVILLNRGKSIESGIAFGRIVLSRSKRIPIVQIEHPTENGVVIPWNDALAWAESIADILNLQIKPAPPAQDIRVVRTENGLTHRRIHDVLPGENIRVGGIVVGTAISDDVEIIVDDGRIVDITGVRVKEHGIEKLGKINIEKAIIRTGSIRRTNHAPRIGITDRQVGSPLRAVLIDHNAESSFELTSDADLAVTVGDDTTAIAGDILYRLGIPVIGITDMDLDYVLCDANILPGSIILRVEPGYDDIVGNMVHDMVFGGKNHTVAQSIESIREQVVGIAKEKLVEVLSY
ncbi:MAG: DUF2117 domain-containing protein [Euryarchaeota archaeon]|nr:DUF2117 domain-containing protein [Euryarchaeota archaeon]